MRLAVLQAVDRHTRGAPNPYLAAAQSFIQRGLPAAVAVQAALGERTLVFTQNFYDRIADYSPVHEALTEARAMETYPPGAGWASPYNARPGRSALCRRPAPNRAPQRSGFRIV